MRDYGRVHKRLLCTPSRTGESTQTALSASRSRTGESAQTILQIEAGTQTALSASRSRTDESTQTTSRTEAGSAQTSERHKLFEHHEGWGGHTGSFCGGSIHNLTHADLSLKVQKVVRVHKVHTGGPHGFDLYPDGITGVI